MKRKLSQEDDEHDSRKEPRAEPWLAVCFYRERPRLELGVGISTLAKFHRDQEHGRVFCAHEGKPCEGADSLPGIELPLTEDEKTFLSVVFLGDSDWNAQETLDLRLESLWQICAFLGLKDEAALRRNAELVLGNPRATLRTKVSAAAFDVFEFEAKVEDPSSVAAESTVSWLAKSKYLVHHGHGDFTVKFPFSLRPDLEVRDSLLRNLQPDKIVGAGGITKHAVGDLFPIRPIAPESDIDAFVLNVPEAAALFRRLAQDLQDDGYVLSVPVNRFGIVNATRQDSRPVQIIFVAEATTTAELIGSFDLHLAKAAFWDLETVSVSMFAARDWTTRRCNNGTFSTIRPARLRKAQRDGFQLTQEATECLLLEPPEEAKVAVADKELTVSVMEEILAFLEKGPTFDRLPLDFTYDPKVTIRGVFNDSRFSFEHYLKFLEVGDIRIHGIGGLPGFVVKTPFVLRLPRGSFSRFWLNRSKRGECSYFWIDAGLWPGFKAKHDRILDWCLAKDLLPRVVSGPREDSKRWLRVLIATGCEFQQNGLRATDGAAAVRLKHDSIDDPPAQVVEIDAQPCRFVDLDGGSIIWLARRVAWTTPN